MWARRRIKVLQLQRESPKSLIWLFESRISIRFSIDWKKQRAIVTDERTKTDIQSDLCKLNYPIHYWNCNCQCPSVGTVGRSVCVSLFTIRVGGYTNNAPIPSEHLLKDVKTSCRFVDCWALSFRTLHSFSSFYFPTTVWQTAVLEKLEKRKIIFTNGLKVLWEFPNSMKWKKV